MVLLEIGSRRLHPPCGNPMAQLQSSKWLKVQVLLEKEELRAVFEELSPCSLFQAGSILAEGQDGRVSTEQLLQVYGTVVDALKRGDGIEESFYRQLLSSILTSEPQAIEASIVAENKRLLSFSRPVIQLQAHRIGYSVEENVFRSMVFGPDTIFWGLQFSYPQISYNPTTDEWMDLNDAAAYPNTVLFRKLQKAIRALSIPTPFVVSGQLQNVPIRIGKNCFSWINRHPQLIKWGITVQGATEWT